ncbi:hypothetical protein XELAEV_18001174mg [Xenopus laevis]|nr:hypothetical protein XELAEV_18001174mg [Xenopus laevis]
MMDISRRCTHLHRKSLMNKHLFTVKKVANFKLAFAYYGLQGFVAKKLKRNQALGDMYIFLLSVKLQFMIYLSATFSKTFSRFCWNLTTVLGCAAHVT